MRPCLDRVQLGGSLHETSRYAKVCETARCHDGMVSALIEFRDLTVREGQGGEEQGSKRNSTYLDHCSRVALNFVVKHTLGQISNVTRQF